MQKTTEPLSERQLEILTHLAQGKTQKEVATDLGIALQTVKNHNYITFQRLDVKNCVEAVTKAIRLGLMPSILGVSPEQALEMAYRLSKNLKEEI